MIYLIGGPPRVGKSTLAWMLLEREGLPGCPTDALVSMLQGAAPEHGVRHGTHPDKAVLAQPFLIEFIRAAAEALDASDPQDGYVVEGDIVTPAAATAAAALGIPLTSVFLGNTKLTPANLRATPDWFADADDTTYREIAAWVRERSAALRAACTASGHVYVELGTGYTHGIEQAYSTLLERS
ncbi:hypothetical protein [Streptomyces virginiae]|uniref:hypothetical protein n=1 Tax=Streptomyces virginiae TaxID=1961 RepID=UPI002253F02F|nr:hypothetical protein [Streptomyces virginiae]MCX5276902.1 hypothetical protein [Streptomyces virginiae]